MKLQKKTSSLKHIKILTRKDEDLIVSMSSIKSDKSISMEDPDAKKVSGLEGALALRRQKDRRSNFVESGKTKKEEKKEAREKAYRLLRENMELINACEQELNKTSLCKYVINGRVDSVLVKKKKIRLLKECIRKVTEEEAVTIEVYHKVLEYLDIFEAHCELLMQVQGKPPNHEEIEQFVGELDLINELKKKQLKFYDLSNGYFYGEADDHIFDYYSSAPSHRELQVRQNPIEKVLPVTEERVERESDLVQVCLANVVEAETVKPREKSKAKGVKRERRSKFEKLREKLMERMRGRRKSAGEM